MDQESLLSQLESIVGAKNFSINPEDLKIYGMDSSASHALDEITADPLAVLFPENSEQIQSVVLLANELELKLVPSGGRTGLSGGACATNREIVISLQRMNQITGFNEASQTVTCQAGVTTQTLHQFAEKQNLFFPVDLAASGSSQIGGNVATNAGGNRVLRYGMVRQWVRNLTVVTGKGELLTLSRGLKKDNTGYELMQLFIGSEGTLGIICEVTLELTRIPHLQTALLGLQQFSQAQDLLAYTRQNLQLASFEYFSGKALTYCLQASGNRAPMTTEYPHYVLLEHDGSADDLSQRLNQWHTDNADADIIVATSLKQAKALWQYREGISSSLTPHQPIKCDIGIPPSQLPEFVSQLELTIDAYTGWELVLFGHLGDGNLHVNILYQTDTTTVPQNHRNQREALLESVYQHTAENGGTISAEHGIGLLKKNFWQLLGQNNHSLYYTRSIKHLFDPKGVLNPGKVFPDSAD